MSQGYVILNNLMIATMPGAIAQVKVGRLRALGISSTRRSSVLPKVPTIAESGLPRYEFVAWFGMLAPTGTPASLVDYLNKLISNAISDSSIRSKLDTEGVTATTNPPSAATSNPKPQYGQ